MAVLVLGFHTASAIIWYTHFVEDWEKIQIVCHEGTHLLPFNCRRQVHNMSIHCSRVNHVVGNFETLCGQRVGTNGAPPNQRGGGRGGFELVNHKTAVGQDSDTSPALVSCSGGQPLDTNNKQQDSCNNCDWYYNCDCCWPSILIDRRSPMVG